MANGMPDDLPFADAVEISRMLVKAGRAVHPDDWVEDFARRKAKAEQARRLRSIV